MLPLQLDRDSSDRNGGLVYRVEYTSPGQGSVVTTYRASKPLERGQWIAVDGGAYLVVERVTRAKRGDPYVGVALCKLTTA